MRHTHKLFPCLSIAAMTLAATAFPAHAQVVTYPSRAAFDTAAPTTTLVDFEAGTITTPATGALFTGPLNSATNNAVFATGQIPAGISIDNSCANPLRLVGPGGPFGGGGLPSQGLLPDSDACSLNVQFATPVSALAMDIFAESNSGYRVSLYGAGNTLIGHYDGSAQDTTAGFFGVTSTTPIHLAVVKAPTGVNTGNFEVIDNVAFAATRSGMAVPTLGTLGLALTALALMTVGMFISRKRQG